MNGTKLLENATHMMTHPNTGKRIPPPRLWYIDSIILIFACSKFLFSTRREMARDPRNQSARKFCQSLKERGKKTYPGVGSVRLDRLNSQIARHLSVGAPQNIATNETRPEFLHKTLPVRSLRSHADFRIELEGQWHLSNMTKCHGRTFLKV